MPINTNYKSGPRAWSKFFQAEQGACLGVTLGHSELAVPQQRGRAGSITPQAWQDPPPPATGWELVVGQNTAPTHPRLGLNPGQQLRLVVCIQDHEGHEGAVDVPPASLSLLTVGLHTHAHLHAEGEGELLPCWTDFLAAMPLPAHPCSHTYACIPVHTHAPLQCSTAQIRAPLAGNPEWFPFINVYRAPTAC